MLPAVTPWPVMQRGEWLRVSLEAVGAVGV